MKKNQHVNVHSPSRESLDLEVMVEEGLNDKDSDMDTKSTASSSEAPQSSDDEGDREALPFLPSFVRMGAVFISDLSSLALNPLAESSRPDDEEDEAEVEATAHCCPALIPFAEVFFLVAVVSSLGSIFYAYARSWNDMQDDPDWSISRILAYDYNLVICYAAVLPSYLVMITTYLLKNYQRKHVQRAAAIGVVGGILAFTLDVEGYPTWHGFAAFLLLLAAFSLRKDANSWQSIVVGIGFILAVASCIFRLIFRHYGFGITMAIGEFLILVPWAFMMFNKN